MTSSDERGKVSFSFKELDIMLRECEGQDTAGRSRFSDLNIPCLAIVMRKWHGYNGRSKMLVLLFKGRAYTKRPRHIDDEILLP